MTLYPAGPRGHYARQRQTGRRATIKTQRENLLGGSDAGACAMQDRLDDPPIVRCPGCDLPMEARGSTPATERLVDVRYVCAGCGMETKRSIADEAR